MTHLHLIFEISSLKNQVRGAGFFVYLELDFYCLCSLQKSSLKWKKNPVRQRFFELDISKIKWRSLGRKYKTTLFISNCLENNFNGQKRLVFCSISSHYPLLYH